MDRADVGRVSRSAAKYEDATQPVTIVPAYPSRATMRAWVTEIKSLLLIQRSVASSFFFYLGRPQQILIAFSPLTLGPSSWAWEMLLGRKSLRAFRSMGTSTTRWPGWRPTGCLRRLPARPSASVSILPARGQVLKGPIHCNRCQDVDPNRHPTRQPTRHPLSRPLALALQIRPSRSTNSPSRPAGLSSRPTHRRAGRRSGLALDARPQRRRPSRPRS